MNTNCDCSPKDQQKEIEMFHKIFILILLYSCLYAQDQLTILFTNNINGELENCLCDEKPYGALEKIAYQIAEIRKKHDQVLVFDAGDFYTPFGDVEKNLLVNQAQQIINYDVLTLGDQEFASGVRIFRSIIYPKTNGYQTVNLSFNRKPGSAVKYFKLRDNTRIAVFGLISNDVFKYYSPEKIRGIKIEDPELYLNKKMSEIKEKSDFIIVLSHLGLEKDQTLAETTEDIDLIIGGHSQNIVLNPIKIKETYIVQSGSNGFYLGQLHVSFTKYKLVESIESKPITITKDLPNHPDVVDLAIKNNFKDFRTFLNANKFESVIPNDALISKPDDCITCHDNEYQAWKKTRHFTSFNTLKKEHKTRRLKCVACHVSGFGREDGFINENLTPGLSMITCTECHLTSRQHLSNTKAEDVKKINNNTCIHCHDLENDPDFNFEKDIELVKH